MFNIAQLIFQKLDPNLILEELFNKIKIIAKILKL